MPLVVALVAKEFQTWLRARLTFLVFGGLVVGVSALVFLLGLLILAPDANVAPALLTTPTGSAPPASGNLLIQNRALFLFGAAGVCLLLAAGVLAPAVAASAFAAERDRHTLDLLLLQGSGAGRIVVGKVLAALVFSLLILLVGAPLLAPAWVFGGVSADHVLALTTVLVCGTFFFSALGVFLGAVVRGALSAALLAQAVVLFLLFGTLGGHLLAASLGGSDLLRPTLWLNPFLALLSAGGSVTDAFARLAPSPYRGALSLPPSTWLPGLVLPAWVLASALWLAIGTLLAFCASVAIDPCHPLKAHRRA